MLDGAESAVKSLTKGMDIVSWNADKGNLTVFGQTALELGELAVFSLPLLHTFPPFVSTGINETPGDVPRREDLQGLCGLEEGFKNLDGVR